MGEASEEIDHDAVWPRDELHRYRIYGVIGSEMKVLAACPNPGGIGEALVALNADAEQAGGSLNDEGRIGVLDVLWGKWIVLPFDRAGTHLWSHL